MTRLRILLAALPLAATLSVAGAAGEAHALTSCHQVNGSWWTSVQCDANGGYQFVRARQTCVLNWYTYVHQEGQSAGQGRPSSAGPCSAIIVNRGYFGTNSP